MNLSNTKKIQDDVIDQCEAFGGKALELAEIAQELDERLTKALEEIEELKDQLAKYN